MRRFSYDYSRCWLHLRVPDTNWERTILDLFEEDWLWPRPNNKVRGRTSKEIGANVPLIHDDEESADDGSRNGIGIELANTSDKHRPRHSSQEAVDIG